MGSASFGGIVFAGYPMLGAVPVEITAISAGGDMIVPVDDCRMVVQAEDTAMIVEEEN
jgi:hypothetical protein